MSSPLSKSFDVVFVTPAFPGGAAPRDKETFDGVRPSSVIYGLRFLFRAMAGGMLGAGLDNLALLRRAESYLFGGVHDGGFAARVSVSILNNGRDKAKPFGEIEESAGRDYVLRYLAYGLYPTNFRETWERLGLPAGSGFSFALRASPLVPCRTKTPLIAPFPEHPMAKAPLPAPELIFDLAVKLAHAWIAIGGVGARWRHGLGSMRLSTPSQPATSDYLKFIIQVLNDAREAVRLYLSQALPWVELTSQSALPEFPIAHERYFQPCFKPDGGNTHRVALRIIKDLWRKARLKNPSDARSTSRNSPLYASFVRGEPVAGRDIEFAGLGLPIPFGFPKSLKKETGELVPKGLERRASPIWFRVVEVQPNRYAILALLWRSRYLPESSGVVIRRSKADGQQASLSYDSAEADAWVRTHLVRSGFRMG